MEKAERQVDERGRRKRGGKCFAVILEHAICSRSACFPEFRVGFWFNMILRWSLL